MCPNWWLQHRGEHVAGAGEGAAGVHFYHQVEPEHLFRRRERCSRVRRRKLTRKSMCPKCSSVSASATRSTATPSRTSSSAARAQLPSASISRTVLASSSAAWGSGATGLGGYDHVAPFGRRRRSASAFPTPREAPVTIATRPANFIPPAYSSQQVLASAALSVETSPWPPLRPWSVSCSSIAGDQHRRSQPGETSSRSTIRASTGASSARRRSASASPTWTAGGTPTRSTRCSRRSCAGGCARRSPAAPG